MSKIQYRHIDFDGASLIQRRHKRQVVPPGMWAVTNFLPSRSDKNITLRPDFVQENATIFGISSGLQIQNFDETKDFLNSVHGIYGSSNLVWFTSYIPWGYYGDEGALQILSSTMTTGRVSAVDNSYTASFNNLGAYDIRTKWWRGCILEFNGDGNYYVLDSIYAGDASAQTGTVVLTMPTQADYSNEINYLHADYKWTASQGGTNEYYLELTAGGDPTAIEPIEVLLDDVSLAKGTVGSLTVDQTWGFGHNAADEAATNNKAVYDTVYIRDNTDDPDDYAVTFVGRQGHTYTLYRTHNSMRAGDNKILLDEFAGALIYCNPTIEDDFSAEDICGPLYSNVTESEWQYNVTAHNADSFDTNNERNYVTTNYGLATTGTSWIAITSADHYGFARTLDISSDNTWTWFDFNDLTVNVPQPNTDDVLGASGVRLRSIRRNSSLGFLASGSLFLNSVIGSNAWYNAVFYSTDQGYTWTAKIDTAHSGGAAIYYSPGCEYDGTTLFMVANDSGTNYLRYSTNGGDTWSNCTGVASVTGSIANARVRLLGDTFVFINSDGKIYHSTNGQAFTEKDISADVGSFACSDISYNNGDGGTDYWIATDDTNSLVARATTVGGTYTNITPSWASTVTSRYDIQLNHIFYDVLAKRFLLSTGDYLTVSTDYGATWEQNLAGFGSVAQYGSPNMSNIDWSGQVLAVMYDYYGTRYAHMVIDRSYTVSWDVDLFTPISDLYRATTFSVIDGYNVLIGTREWDAVDEEWDYHPKRIRWTVPGTYSDFTAVDGAGTADATGPGAFLTSVVVNGRIVVFETNRVSAIVPRGDTDDPFDFDVIKDDFKFSSNPVVVDDVAYVIGSDGLLWSTDGINVAEVGASFDITKFDDYTESKPVWLIFSRADNCLYAFFRDSTVTTHPAYCISLSTGGVTQVNLLEVDNATVKSEKPAGIASTDGSTEQNLYVTHHPFADDADQVSVARFRAGDKITGIDYLSASESGYWSAALESGELYITQEGEKSSVKHIIAETYTAASVGDNSDRPYLAAEVKSIEDSDFATIGDTVGTATLSTTALTGVDTAWSNTIAAGDDASTVFTLPCLATQARVYIDSTLQVLDTDYTITDTKEITLTSVLALGTTLYAYWENVPEIKVKVGDFFKSTEGWHRVTAVNTSTDIDCDHYLSTGSETVTHYPAWQLDDGHGRVELGINRLVEGVQIRLYLIPDYDGTQQSTIAKITGLSIGYVPQGRKLVKATGS